MTQKTALITGVSGQDGSLLAKHLLENNYKVIAPTRKNPNLFRLGFLQILEHENLELVTYKNWLDFEPLILNSKPDEIYHLAAMSHVGESHENPEKVFNVNSLWTTVLLQIIEKYSRGSKFFFASSCEIFKSAIESKVTEKNDKSPNNPYGISKLAAHQMVEYYRKTKGLFACNGILFNHESSLREGSFVSKKICENVARIVQNGGPPLSLGNIEAKKDWGYAPDFIKAFPLILNRQNASDYILSTGQLHSVKDMVNAAFNSLDYPLFWKNSGIKTTAVNKKGQVVVDINPKYFRPVDNRFLIGDNTKARIELDFTNNTPFNSWVKAMTLHELEKTL